MTTQQTQKTQRTIEQTGASLRPCVGLSQRWSTRSLTLNALACLKFLKSLQGGPKKSKPLPVFFQKNRIKDCQRD